MANTLRFRAEKALSVQTLRRLWAPVMLASILGALPAFSQRAAEIAVQPAPGIPSTKLTIVGLEADFHPLVLELLNDVGAGKAAATLPAKPVPCASDELVAVQAAKTCRLPEKITKALAATEFHCRRVYEPLDMYGRLPPRLVEFSDTKSVPTMLKVFGIALTKTQLPGAFRRADFKTAADSVTRKVFADEFARGLGARAQALQQAQEACGIESTLAQAVQEIKTAQKAHATAQASWKKIDNLPYPTLTRDERRLLAMYLSTMSWRSRGGGIYKKVPGVFATQKLRVKYIWNAYTTILDLLGSGKATSGMAFGLYTRGFRGWHDFWDMGTNDRHTLEEDFKLMTERGVYQTASAVATAQGYGIKTAPLAAAGARMGACYLYGWHAMPKVKPAWGPELEIPFKNIGGGPTQWGELCFGASLGLGLFETFLSQNRPAELFDDGTRP